MILANLDQLSLMQCLELFKVQCIKILELIYEH